ncbi:MAG: G1 family glutamic endopeptidase [Streptosporangiaceae bacterium]
MRKLHRAGAAVAVLSLVLTVSAFTREGMRSTVTASPGTASSGTVSPGGPMIIAGHTGPAGLARPGHTVIHSLNWAGYAGNRAGTTFRFVSAAFQVPYVNCAAATTSYSSHWVGLDGLGSASVEQVGIEADCSGSTPQYYAWYEMYPKPVSVAFTVRAGNAVQASVTYKKSARKFVLMLRDSTSGRRFTRTLKCAAKACLRSSAEVISEAPSNGSRGILPLADYRAASFSSITLTTSRGHRSGLSSRSWNTYQIIGVGDSSHELAAQPTSLFRGQAFSTYWFRAS